MWITTAQHYIPPEVTVKGFKKCCISNKVAKTYDDILWNGTEDGNVRSECKEGEGTECADGESNTGW